MAIKRRKSVVIEPSNIDISITPIFLFLGVGIGLD
jgi:hypothetical protein